MTGELDMAHSQRLEATAEAPSRARAFCSEVLGDVLTDGELAQEVLGRACLVISELVTNAVLAGSRHIVLTLSVDLDELRVIVADQAAGDATPGTAGPTDEHGRGLQMVSRASTSWGVDQGDGTKAVWAVIALPHEATRPGP